MIYFSFQRKIKNASVLFLEHYFISYKYQHNVYCHNSNKYNASDYHLQQIPSFHNIVLNG